ncbi:hypothetical protein POM88_044955 [Heracleum sosnowskyi]|uniref:Uncharacterized protein n=1 Tax=Heracleum sosnowskyi TaxID=360622 RepID=A0AAD8M4F4_9APIA|nr:hypothetical protein POM88_044955 [Heracleum sosnowskyi]
MVTLSDGGNSDTPLGMELNGAATLIEKMVVKPLNNKISKWSTSDALNLLNFFAISVTILVVVGPEGLPLTVTLSLAFAMQKLLNDKDLLGIFQRVRQWVVLDAFVPIKLELGK